MQLPLSTSQLSIVTPRLMTTVGGMVLATLQSLIVRYFPHPPTQFDSTSTPADIYDFVVGETRQSQGREDVLGGQFLAISLSPTQGLRRII